MLRCELHMACGLVQACAFTVRTHLLNQVFNFRLGKTLLAAFLIVVSDGIVKHLALVFGQLHTGAHALGAPTVFAVVAEQTRIEFVVRGAAFRASSECGEHIQCANVSRSLVGFHRFLQAIQIAQYMHHTFAQLQGFGQRFSELFFLIGTDFEAGHG